jgi:hypothetical protein
MRITGLCLALAGSIGLAACGGGSNDDDGGGLNGGTLNAFDILRSEFDALEGEYGALQPTNPADMPRIGSALYAGNAVYSDVDGVDDVDIDFAEIIANPSSASRVEITADFFNSELGGRLFDFRSSNPNVSMDGELQIVNGLIGGSLIGGEIDGSLTINGLPADHSGGTLFGSFIGPDAEAVGGTISRGSSPTPFNGSFVAER